MSKELERLAEFYAKQYPNSPVGPLTKLAAEISRRERGPENVLFQPENSINKTPGEILTDPKEIEREVYAFFENQPQKGLTFTNELASQFNTSVGGRLGNDVNISNLWLPKSKVYRMMELSYPFDPDFVGRYNGAFSILERMKIKTVGEFRDADLRVLIDARNLGERRLVFFRTALERSTSLV